jgi:hypothetical protein
MTSRKKPSVTDRLNSSKRESGSLQTPCSGKRTLDYRDTSTFRRHERSAKRRETGGTLWKKARAAAYRRMSVGGDGSRPSCPRAVFRMPMHDQAADAPGPCRSPFLDPLSPSPARPAPATVLALRPQEDRTPRRWHPTCRLLPPHRRSAVSTCGAGAALAPRHPRAVVPCPPAAGPSQGDTP